MQVNWELEKYNANTKGLFQHSDCSSKRCRGSGTWKTITYLTAFKCYLRQYHSEQKIS